MPNMLKLAIAPVESLAVGAVAEAGAGDDVRGTGEPDAEDPPAATRAAGRAEPFEPPPSWLGDDERRRLATLTGPARQAFVASRALTRQLLAEATGVSAVRWNLSAPAGRAPEASVLEDGPGAPASAPRVSLAHRLGWVVAAVADGDVGVDIECERPVRSSPAERAAVMLTPDEIAEWRRLPEAEREPALLRAWVAKEAWFKAVPAGTAPWDFRHVHVRACPPEKANVRVWSARPLWVAVCREDAEALAAVDCAGLPEGGPVDETWWRVGPSRRL
jgi:phosphopantetheinyl transferase